MTEHEWRERARAWMRGLLRSSSPDAWTDDHGNEAWGLVSGADPEPTPNETACGPPLTDIMLQARMAELEKALATERTVIDWIAKWTHRHPGRGQTP